MVRKHHIRMTAIIAVLGYAVFRFYLVKTSLEGYGVNAWIFLLIDICTGITYVLGLEKLILGLKGETSFFHTLLWGGVAITSFLGPYVYLYMSGQDMPVSIFWGIGIIIFLLAGNAVRIVIRESHKK